MRILTAVVLSFILSTTVALDSGCSSGCDASCAGRRAEITAAGNIAVVEVCDSTGACTRQEFGPSAGNVLNHSFSMWLPDQGSTARVTLSGYGDDGSLLASGEVESAFGESDCGCRGPARFSLATGYVGAPGS